jgi:hypothetical protein
MLAKIDGMCAERDKLRAVLTRERSSAVRAGMSEPLKWYDPDATDRLGKRFRRPARPKKTPCILRTTFLRSGMSGRAIALPTGISEPTIRHASNGVVLVALRHIAISLG